MKMNKIIAMLFAGGLTFSGVAGAGPLYTAWEWAGKLGGGSAPGSSWKNGNVGPNTIGDYDVNPTIWFTLDTSVNDLFSDSTYVTIGNYSDEPPINNNIPGFDKVEASANNGISGTVLAYTVTTTSLKGLNQVALDAVAIGGNPIEVTKEIYDYKGGNLLMTLSSINGREPSTGYSFFSPSQLGINSFYVVDTIVSGNVRHLGNEFATDGKGPQPPGGVPEIDAMAGTGALTLLAGALALVGERRRRKA